MLPVFSLLGSYVFGKTVSFAYVVVRSVLCVAWGETIGPVGYALVSRLFSFR